MSEKPTGTCRECGRVFRLTMRDGVWSHGNGVKDPVNPYYRQNCPGSGQDPKQRIRMGRDYSPGDVFRALGEPVPQTWLDWEAENGWQRPAALSQPSNEGDNHG